MDFDDFFKQLLESVEQLAKTSWKDFSKAALSDGKAFLKDSKADLQRWMKLLAGGDLTKEEFEFLVAAKKDVAELAALKRAGLTAVAMDRFKNTMVNLVIDKAFEAIA